MSLTSGDFSDYSDKKLYEWFVNILQNQNSKNFIIENEKGIVIGHAGLEIKNNKAEYNIVIGNKTYIGKGYGSLVHTKILVKAFKNYGVDKGFLKVRPENIRAIKSYEKAGFKKVCKRKYKNPNSPELVIMEIKKL
ncbi:MAG: GNAT family N-acetyltransferase [Candidatus Pacebacteria bacterium]|nr:GNAT family N-acetyltransferase [Candidatus Paceibacterota bacterium]